MSTTEQQTYTIDAQGKSLGRLASEVATILRGKHRVSFQPHLVGNDRVVVQHIDQVKITGRKLEQKVYYRNTGYPGGIRKKLMKEIKQQDPAQLLRMTITGMLPDTTHRRQMLKRLIIE